MNFVHQMIDAFYQVPAYCRAIASGRFMIASIVVAIVFLIVLFFTNRLVNILRRLFVLATIVLAVAAYFKNKFPLLWVCILTLIILGLVRLIRHIFVTVRQDRINERIEAKALAKARKRRGSWQNKQGYSGEAKPLVLDDEPIREEEEEDLEDTAEAVVLDSEVKAKIEKEEAAEDATVGSYGNRRQIMETIQQLKELKDKGVLTEEEYNKKKADLYSRLG